MYPVSLSRIIVGMPFGRYRRIFITSLNMVCSFVFSSLPMVQPSHAYVIIGMMMASTICHIACIFIPLNSFLPVSEMILAVAPFIFLSISAIWSDRLPLLFRISPRYLYDGTSSSSPFTYQLVFPKPLTRPLLLKQCLPLGSADQGTGPQLNLLRESVLSGASLCSPQWLRNRGQPAGQPAVVKVSFFHIYILARNDYFIHTCHKSLIKIDTLNMKIDWVFMKIWINNKI